jgi:hypothetical protein
MEPTNEQIAAAQIQLYGKLVNLMETIQTLEKTGEMMRDGKVQYNYLKGSDLLAAVHPEMVRLKLLMMGEIIEHKEWERPGKTVGVTNFVSIKKRFRWIDAESGAVAIFDGLGQGMDSGDKAPQKAAYAALKYALRDNLLIADDTDDGDKGEEAESKKRGRKTAEEKRKYETIDGIVTRAERLSPDSLWLMVNGNRLHCTAKPLCDQLSTSMGKKVELNAFWGTVGKNKTPVMIISGVLGVYNPVPVEPDYVKETYIQGDEDEHLSPDMVETFTGKRK